MFDLKKLEDNNAIFWIFKFPEYRRIAAECGWAIAIHGSAVHDLDLMAMPWIENHTTADELAQRLTDTEQPNFRRPYEKSKPGDKPNGRIVYTIFTGGTYIDMNVIEGFGKNAVVENVIEWLHAHTAMSEYEYELMRKELEK
jgi:peptidoglycan/xylan/chitin deacetylase (PgdA/CDA1 family)